MNNIGIDELVFNNDIENGIYSGGFSVKSIMMKNGISPISTLNLQKGGDMSKVSELFNDLVVPNWLLSKPYHFGGGGIHVEDDLNTTEPELTYDDNIEPDLHDKLVELASINMKPNRQNSKKLKKMNKKITRKNRIKK
jgi:hypothetical protein